MSEDMITRCSKCSTAFRVGADVLDIAKGMVRCGQCFHIFDARATTVVDTNKTTGVHKSKAPPSVTEADTINPSQQNSQQQQLVSNELPLEKDEPINSDWLQTLFDDDDLAPIDKTDHQANLNKQSKRAFAENALAENPPNTAFNATTNVQDEPAPWEREYAELDHNNDDEKPSQPTHPIHAKNQPSKSNQKNPLNTVNKAISPATAEAIPTKPVVNNTTQPQQTIQPDYMLALNSLAHPDQFDQPYSNTAPGLVDHIDIAHINEHLDPLMGTRQGTPPSTSKKKYRGLFLLANLLALILLIYQVTWHYFDIGSRSATFRPLYKTLCTYGNCTLPQFEDITAINIQHVRVQSHPTDASALMVNAIMTNTSTFSQPMPNIALEFFDLNGTAVAARLFSPKNFLHKDFLDITYMPPETPIHIVIPIQDPGTHAVTHQLKVFSSKTQSY